jgi:hydroxymethylglutaryl-CoA lyase
MNWVANPFCRLDRHILEHFDSAAGGLGGCPYAPGATGNVATEDVVTAALNAKTRATK